MSNETLWNYDEPIEALIRLPNWIESNITGTDVAALIQGGCASGAYMPAVTYHRALNTMSRYGDDVLNFIEGHLGEAPLAPGSESWAGIAVYFLSMAVELWANSVEDELTEAIENRAATLDEIAGAP